jgi:riboflavin biosynthesis pyrimidine reductase
VHALREQYDAVAVGGRTWNLDQPRLTARAEHLGREPLRQPARVVFAGGQCREARGGGRLFVVTSSQAGAEGAHIIRSGGRDLKEPLNTLFELGMRTILVEGGPTLAGSFLAQEFADRITVFVRTERPQRAEGASHLALPGLPLRVSAAPLGEGFLVSHQRVAAGSSFGM